MVFLSGWWGSCHNNKLNFVLNYPFQKVKYPIHPGAGKLKRQILNMVQGPVIIVTVI